MNLPEHYGDLPITTFADGQGCKLERRHSLHPNAIRSLEKDFVQALSGAHSVQNIHLNGNSSEDILSQASAQSTSFMMESIVAQSPSNESPPTPSTITSSPASNEPIKKSCFDSCCNLSTPTPTQNVDKGPKSAYSIENHCSELLPPIDEADETKLTLVLDLDETLVHSSFIAIPNPDFVFTVGIDSNKLNVFVCIRPGAEAFLKDMSELYEVVIFTASSQYYADCVIDHIDPHKYAKHRLYRESCTNLNDCFVKDLSKLGREVDRTLIVDNSSVAYLLHPYNAVPISSWYDDREDRELELLSQFLTENHQASTVYEFLVETQ